LRTRRTIGGGAAPIHAAFTAHAFGCSGRSHELRLRDRAGIYRVFYALVVDGDIWLLHAYAKKTQAATPHTIELVRKRLKEIMP
jgi:phage-related protein